MSAAYIRVSSRGQHFDLQLHAIEAQAALRGDSPQLFEEKRSGSQLARPQLDRLRLAVKSGHVKRIYVFRLDRLTRSGIRDTFELVEELRAHGCELITCSDGFDLSGPLAEPLIALMAWAARMENHARRERQAAARERIEAKGGEWGRPRRMTAAQLAKAKAMRSEQRPKSLRAISVALKLPLATLARALKRGVP